MCGGEGDRILVEVASYFHALISYGVASIVQQLVPVEPKIPRLNNYMCLSGAEQLVLSRFWIIPASLFHCKLIVTGWLGCQTDGSEISFNGLEIDFGNH